MINNHMSHVTWLPSSTSHILSSNLYGITNLYDLFVQHTITHPGIYSAKNLSIHKDYLEVTSLLIPIRLHKYYKYISWIKLVNIFQKIGQAICFIHAQGISHNNLHLSNITIINKQAQLFNFKYQPFDLNTDWVQFAKLWLHCLNINKLKPSDINYMDLQSKLFQNLPPDLSEDENIFYLEELPQILYQALNNTCPTWLPSATSPPPPLRESRNLNTLTDLAQKYFSHMNLEQINRAQDLWDATQIYPEFFNRQDLLPITCLWIISKMVYTPITPSSSLVANDDIPQLLESERYVIYIVLAHRKTIF